MGDYIIVLNVKQWLSANPSSPFNDCTPTFCLHSLSETAHPLMFYRTPSDFNLHNYLSPQNVSNK